jgi:tRNA pseudouridine65 synthase
MKNLSENAFLITDVSGNIFLKPVEGRFEVPFTSDLENCLDSLPQAESLITLTLGTAGSITVFLLKNQLNNVENLYRTSFSSALGMVLDGSITDAATVASILMADKLKLFRTELEILFRDEYCVAVNKPSGLLVHRTRMASDNDFALQRLRDQIKRKVFPIHRLDRPTSGVLLFGLSNESAAAFFEIFRERKVEKTYIALVRGWVDDSGIIDRPMKSGKNGVVQEAVTEYEKLATAELPIAVRPYDTSRYSLVKINLKTGRTHQIRRHFNSISHPVIGDTIYGDGCHNRMFREHFNINRLMLMSVKLEFDHPFTGEHTVISAPPDKEFLHALEELGMEPSVLFTS